VAVVVAYLEHPDSGVVNAAFSALRAVELVCQHGGYADLPRSVWAFEGVVDAVRSLLASERFSARLAAARFVAEVPTEALAEALCRRLDDPLFTVRWCAIRALATLAPTPELADALVDARPRSFDPASLARSAHERVEPRHWAFLDALDALGPLRDDVVHRLLR
jgi:HEAT repeat protein